MRKTALGLLFAAAIGLAGGSAHAASGTQNQSEPQKHTVASGESLSSIAADNNLPSWMVLWDTNTDLQNPDQINVGEVITIPVAPYPATDRALPAGYDAPAVSAAPAATSGVSYHPAASSAVVTGNPSGLAQRVCSRESGCNYAENTGNGYYGAYQFDNGTWGDFGGYASANQAPPAVQDQKFQQEYAARGCSPWPNTCY